MSATLTVVPAGLPAGTTVSVADIFYCVPARRKFLKSDTTELGHIASLVTHYALANPSRQFILSTPTQEVINCAPAEKRSEEHTSELQSRLHLVCRLLLEKKKQSI